MSTRLGPRLPLLLADPSPCLRLLVLRELLERPDCDPEVQELVALRETDWAVSDLLPAQRADGSWRADGRLWRGSPARATALALMRLGYLGFGRGHPAVERGAGYLFSLQQPDGAWPLPGAEDEDDAREGYSMVPLQTSIPLRALAACGYATDPRAEMAYAWLLNQRLADGAWPTGIVSGVYGYVAGYRRIAHSRWGCRSNTTGALICLALHPTQRHGEAAQRALDLLLGRETRERQSFGFEVARTIAVEPARGFTTFYARFDLALLVDLCWRVGVSSEDRRVADLSRFVVGLCGPYGLWEYRPHPEASRWVTFDVARSLSRLDAAGDWVGAEPRTPFQPYPSQPRRY
jgi:hypothetical protein